MAMCGKRKQGEYNELECVLEANHKGEHNYTICGPPYRGRLIGVTFRATPALRYKLRLIEPGVREPVLVQAWVGDDGSTEWRDVPTLIV